MFTIKDERTTAALDIVRAAAAMAREIQTEIRLLQATKPDLSPVTVADYAVQALAAQRLCALFPGQPLVAEETSEHLAGQPDILDAVTEFVGRRIEGARGADILEWIDRGAGTGTDSRAYWVLDPVDGTKGYLRGGQYAVALALVEAGEVRLGVLGCPSLAEDCRPEFSERGRLAVAVRGQGAWQGPPDGSEPFQPIRVSLQTDPRQARLLRSHEAGHTNVAQIDTLARALKINAGPVLMDSQAKCAVLAAGHAEIMLRLLSPDRPGYREKVWDQAAGSIIIEEAGGKITDMNGKPLDFTTGRRLENNLGVAASNGLLHGNVLDALAGIV